MSSQPTSAFASSGQYNLAASSMAREPSTTVMRETVTTHQCNDTLTHMSNDMGRGWAWFGLILIWLIIFLVVFWLIYYSLHPSFVLDPNGQTDTAKVLLYAFITAIVVIIILWIIKAIAGRSSRRM